LSSAIGQTDCRTTGMTLGKLSQHVKIFSRQRETQNGHFAL
jgi:hypothetical protein